MMDEEVSRRGGGEVADDLPSSSLSIASGFRPRLLAFRPYVETSIKPKALRVVVRRPVSF